MKDQHLTQEEQDVLHFYHKYESLPKFYQKIHTDCAEYIRRLEDYLRTVPPSEQNEMTKRAHLSSFNSCVTGNGLVSRPQLDAMITCLRKERHVIPCMKEIKEVSVVGEHILTDVFNIEKDLVEKVKQARKECAEARNKQLLCEQFLKAKTEEQYKIEPAHWEKCSPYQKQYEACVQGFFCEEKLRLFRRDCKDVESSTCKTIKEELDSCFTMYDITMKMMKEK
jgi:hypothetical protein